MKLGDRSNAVDAIRAVAICFVVYIHIFAINPGFVYSSGITWKIVDVLFGVARLAVPIFFAISGWFIFSDDRNKQIAKLEKQIVKLTKVLLIAIAGSGTAFWILTRLHVAVGLDSYFTSTRGLFEMVFLGRTPNGDGPLWFLPSLIIAEILFWLAVKNFKNVNWLAIPAFFFFVVSVLSWAYKPVFRFPSLPPDINETTWFVGFMWFGLGYFLAKSYKDRPRVINVKMIRQFAITSVILYLYEYILNTSGAEFRFGPYNYAPVFIFTPLATAGILLASVYVVKDNKFIRWLAYIGKNYALGVFITHAVIILPVEYVFNRYWPVQSYVTPRLFMTYTTVVVSAFVLTALYYKVKELLIVKYSTQQKSRVETLKT